MSGPLPRWLWPVTIPASWAYGAAVRRRNARFDRLEDVHRLDVPVVSIGNITAGGVGKTPMTRWIAAWLVKQGMRPVIAMRGYKAAAQRGSDEQAEYRHLIPDVPLVVDPDRVTALRAFLATSGADVVLMDDGFQHRRLHRDLDLVLIDASAATFRRRLLPAGYLREPLDSLRRADGVIVTRAQQVDASIADEISRWHGNAALAWSRFRWTAVRVIKAGASSIEPVEWFRDRKVATLLGIGNPRAVIRQLLDLGVSDVLPIPCRDHEVFSARKIRRAAGSGADATVLTLKDHVRTDHMLDDLGTVAIPLGEIEFIEGEDALTQRLSEAVQQGL